MAKPYWVYSDFDGTITLDDNQVKLLDKFADAYWREKEYAILEAGGKSRQYLPVIYRNFGAYSTQEIIEYLRENVRPDPFFPQFVRYCSEHDVPLEIISDGMNIYIEDYLERTGLQDLVFYANTVEVGPQGVVFTHPYENLECGKCGTCKKQIVTARKGQNWFIVYIGDGISDECAVKEADLVYAKGTLARYCQEQGISYVPYETFADILKHFAQLLTEKSGI